MFAVSWFGEWRWDINLRDSISVAAVRRIGNSVGEPVASGVYFYTLTAGNFSATRKMLIRK